MRRVKVSFIIEGIVIISRNLMSHDAEGGGVDSILIIETRPVEGTISIFGLRVVD